MPHLPITVYVRKRDFSPNAERTFFSSGNRASMRFSSGEIRQRGSHAARQGTAGACAGTNAGADREPGSLGGGRDVSASRDARIDESKDAGGGTAIRSMRQRGRTFSRQRRIALWARGKLDPAPVGTRVECPGTGCACDQHPQADLWVRSGMMSSRDIEGENPLSPPGQGL